MGQWRAFLPNDELFGGAVAVFVYNRLICVMATLATRTSKFPRVAPLFENPWSVSEIPRVFDDSGPIADLLP